MKRLKFKQPPLPSSSLLLTTEVIIADAPKDEVERAHGPGAGDMGCMM